MIDGTRSRTRNRIARSGTFEFLPDAAPRVLPAGKSRCFPAPTEMTWTIESAGREIGARTTSAAGAFRLLKAKDDATAAGVKKKFEVADGQDLPRPITPRSPCLALAETATG